MWKTRVILCLILLFGACREPDEVSIKTVGPERTNLSTTTSAVIPTTTILSTTTSTTYLSTTTTSMVSTYQAASTSELTDVWDRLAECESGGNWAKDAYHDGGLQFHPDTWSDYVASGKSYGLVDYPAYAYQATREQQIAVAIRVRDGVPGSSDPYLNPQGWGAWPHCRHIVGV